jgi:hypothetical protein
VGLEGGVGVVAVVEAALRVGGVERARADAEIGRETRATAGEGTQNLMCAAQAAGVLLALVVVAVWPGGWPIDPIIALGIAGWSVWEGNRSWRGADCC